MEKIVNSIEILVLKILHCTLQIYQHKNSVTLQTLYGKAPRRGHTSSTVCILYNLKQIPRCSPVLAKIVLIMYLCLIQNY